MANFEKKAVLASFIVEAYESKKITRNVANKLLRAMNKSPNSMWNGIVINMGVNCVKRGHGHTVKLTISKKGIDITNVDCELETLSNHLNEASGFVEGRI